jgi:hypothetical protein
MTTSCIRRPFVLVHLGCIGAMRTGVTWSALIICAVLYVVRMFAVVAGYHRYFSHRAFATSWTFQFVLAVLAQTTAQKSVLWWAGKHRHHHPAGVRIVNRAAEQLAACFDSERIASAITSTLHGHALSALQESLDRARERAGEVLTTLQLPQMPSHDEFLTQAKAMFARTISLAPIPASAERK